MPREKRFTISKAYEGPPIIMPSGKVASGLFQLVEQYDDELTARVRVALLNEGLPQKKYILEEQVGEGEWVEVENDDDDA